MFSDSLVISKEWGNKRLLKGCTWGECMGSHSVGQPQKREINSVNGCLKNKDVWMLGKQGEWSRIGVNGGGL